MSTEKTLEPVQATHAEEKKGKRTPCVSSLGSRWEWLWLRLASSLAANCGAATNLSAALHTDFYSNADERQAGEFGVGI